MSALTATEADLFHATRSRYSAVAIVLHWLIAAGIVLQIFLGWRMGDVSGAARSAVMQIHKSVGIGILLLTLARLGWRMVNPPPPHTPGLTRAELFLSHWVHIGFYTALIGLPLTGWALVSMRLAGGMKLFGLMPWPRLPLLLMLPNKLQDPASDVFDNTHAALVWVMLGLLALHVAGALKHHFISRDATVARMAPGARPGAAAEPRLIAVLVVIAGLAAAVYLPPLPQAATRPKVTNPARADVYLDIVAPALDRRCGACHNDDQARGGLSLVTYEAMIQGGRGGPVIAPGRPEKSELYRRITLPTDNTKYMPKDGKPPLTPEQVAAIGVWIRAGAPRTGEIGRLNLAAADKIVLQKAVGGGTAVDSGDTAGLPAREVLPVVPAADAKTVQAIEASGFVVRPVSKSSQLLSLNYTAIRPLSADDFNRLAKIAAQIRILNLFEAQIGDAQLKTVAGFANLSQLRLEGNPVTDAGIASLAPLKSLTSLSLADTKVTDGGVIALASALPKLNRLFLWGTPVTAAAVDKIKAGHPGAFVYAGFKPSDVPKEPLREPVD